MTERFQKYPLSKRINMENNIKQKIQNILEYMQEAEETHFEESDKPKDHIFNDVIGVEEWIDSPYCPLLDGEEMREECLDVD